MRETKKSTQEILNDILSRDSHKIWAASCEIASLSQNHEKVMELVPYKQQIIDGTEGIDLGGFFCSNKTHLKRALMVLEFHEQKLFCPCHLLGEFDNPDDLVQDDYFTLVSAEEYSYTVRCNQCGTNYKVDLREYHFIWWEWTPI